MRLKSIMSSIFIAFFSTFASGQDIEVPDDIRETYKHLYEQDVEQLPDGSYKFDKARLFKREGINVVYMEGDQFEMAFQHGALLKDEIINGGSLERASLLVRDILRQNLGTGFVAKLVTNYAYENILMKILRWSLNNPDTPSTSNLHQAWGISEATGVPVQTLIRAALGPETLQVLLAESKNNPWLDGIAGGNTPHCSSFIAHSGATADGDFIIGRNTDYQLNGFYDAHPTVLYFNPTEKDAQKYMGVTSAGLHNAGVQGMNERVSMSELIQWRRWQDLPRAFRFSW